MPPRKTFFITGANSGFGRAIASAAADAGHTVIGTVRSEAAAADIEASVGGRIHGVQLDVTDIEAVPAIVEASEAKFGPVDVLINNAGYGHEGILEESPIEEMRRQFEVNVFGAVAVAKAFLPKFRERRRGFIVNVTSMGGLITSRA
jgi:NAD(P)-dependent dehydrogenase (short-subunit alcohol dehydrogenase family)